MKKFSIKKKIRYKRGMLDTDVPTKIIKINSDIFSELATLVFPKHLKKCQNNSSL